MTLIWLSLHPSLKPSRLNWTLCQLGGPLTTFQCSQELCNVVRRSRLAINDTTCILAYHLHSQGWSGWVNACETVHVHISLQTPMLQEWKGGSTTKTSAWDTNGNAGFVLVTTTIAVRAKTVRVVQNLPRQYQRLLHFLFQTLTCLLVETVSYLISNPTKSNKSWVSINPLQCGNIDPPYWPTLHIMQIQMLCVKKDREGGWTSNPSGIFVLTYGTETWVMKAENLHSLERTERMMDLQSVAEG